MHLVEIVPDSNTSKATVDLAYESMVTVGRTPVVCRKEVPGFVINRLQSAIYPEAFDMVDRGVVTVEEADKAVMGGILYSKFEVYLDDACGHWEPHMNVADSTQFHCFTPAKTIPYLCGH